MVLSNKLLVAVISRSCSAKLGSLCRRIFMRRASVGEWERKVKTGCAAAGTVQLQPVRQTPASNLFQFSSGEEAKLSTAPIHLAARKGERPDDYLQHVFE